MKKKWEYKYPERLVQAMVSEDYVLIGEQLYGTVNISIVSKTPKYYQAAIASSS